MLGSLLAHRLYFNFISSTFNINSVAAANITITIIVSMDVLFAATACVVIYLWKCVRVWDLVISGVVYHYFQVAVFRLFDNYLLSIIPIPRVCSSPMAYWSSTISSALSLVIPMESSFSTTASSLSLSILMSSLSFSSYYILSLASLSPVASTLSSFLLVVVGAFIICVMFMVFVIPRGVHMSTKMFHMLLM